MAAYKIGDIFYSAYAEEGKVHISTHVLRTIRGNVAYVIAKNECTWGKRSKTHGDYGWLDPVSPSWRQAFPLDGTAIKNMSRSVSGALRKAIICENIRGKRFPGDAEYVACIEKNITALKRRLRRGNGES